MRTPYFTKAAKELSILRLAINRKTPLTDLATAWAARRSMGLSLQSIDAILYDHILKRVKRQSATAAPGRDCRGHGALTERSPQPDHNRYHADRWERAPPDGTRNFLPIGEQDASSSQARNGCERDQGSRCQGARDGRGNPRRGRGAQGRGGARAVAEIRRLVARVVQAYRVRSGARDRAGAQARSRRHQIRAGAGA